MHFLIITENMDLYVPVSLREKLDLVTLENRFPRLGKLEVEEHVFFVCETVNNKNHDCDHKKYCDSGHFDPIEIQIAGNRLELTQFACDPFPLGAQETLMTYQHWERAHALRLDGNLVQDPAYLLNDFSGNWKQYKSSFLFLCASRTGQLKKFLHAVNVLAGDLSSLKNVDPVSLANFNKLLSEGVK